MISNMIKDINTNLTERFSESMLGKKNESYIDKINENTSLTLMNELELNTDFDIDAHSTRKLSNIEVIVNYLNSDKSISLEDLRDNYRISSNGKLIPPEMSNVDVISSDLDKIRYIITRNESLEGDLHPITGVPFERKHISLRNGEIIEGVFPNFEYAFEAEISEDLYEVSDFKQFKECNKQLLEEIEKNPQLKKTFNEIQLEQIKEGVVDGSAPEGYVWHHSPESGKIQLVDYQIHAQTGHTGGRSVWGGGNENR